MCAYENIDLPLERILVSHVKERRQAFDRPLWMLRAKD